MRAWVTNSAASMCILAPCRPNSECTASILLWIIIFIYYEYYKIYVNKYDRAHLTMGSYGSWSLESSQLGSLPLSLQELFFSSEIWLLTASGKVLHQSPLGVHGDSPIRACHNSRWHALSPHIPTMLHFLNHMAQRAESLELQLGMLQNMLLLLSTSELADFHDAQYMG